MTVTRRRPARTLLVLVLAAALSGCTPTGGDPVDPDEALATLQARPTSAEATASLTRLRDDIAAAVGGVAGGLDYAASGDGGRSGCGEPFDGLGGDTVSLDFLVAQRNVDDATWPAALDAASALATAAGFDQVVVKVDQPGNHQVRFVNPDGAYLDLGTQVTTLVRGVTACHLPG